MFTATVERLKSAVVSRKHDPKALQESLRQLRSLVEGISGREKFLAESLQVLNERLALYMRAGGALDVALKGDSIEAVRVALDELDQKPHHRELLEAQVRALSRADAMRLPRENFFHEHREAQSVLLNACQLRLSEARAKLESVTAKQQGRLNSLGGEVYDASTSSPVVKRVSAYVARLEGMLTNLEGATAENWQTSFINYAHQLLRE